jgi:gliding motility-associated-like protein/uncharacterized repeat protein (TIGR01451 family)
MQRLIPAPYSKVCTAYLSFPDRKLISGFCLFLLLFVPGLTFAEGSKELNSNGGSRALLFSSTRATQSFPFPTLGTMKVYAKVGETLYLGSSAQGIGPGTIKLRAPDGSTYTSGTSTTIGLIANLSQETAGPQPNAGGYIPYTRAVAAGQEGVWEIDFIPPGDVADQETSPIPIRSDDAWLQEDGPYIAAFDVSVRNVANSSFLKGRVFTNIFSGLLGGFNAGFYGIFHILTKDGYQYKIDNNGQAGNGFSFFSNNKGIRTAGGEASYKSLDTTRAANIHDPTLPDTQSDVTHKIFFNVPATDMPVTARTPGNATTWLLNPPFVPSVSDVKFTGAEGTEGKAGSAPLGGTIAFTATSNGTYSITLDVNNNGVFTDPIDRTLTGPSTLGTNAIKWDGLDGLGNKVPAGATVYTANINLSLKSAEVHFPFFDVERNVNGTKLTRTTGANAPDNTVYWDDSLIKIPTTSPAPVVPSSPIVNLTGMDSFVNGHKWGRVTLTNSTSIDNSDFGNEKSIDTWAFVSNAIINTAVTFIVQEADLEVTSLTSDIAAGCINQKITYTTAVRNNGPGDVAGATFSFAYPAELTDVVVTSEQTTGTTILTNEKTTDSLYSAKLDIPNGAVRTFTITGTVSKVPTSTLDVTAAILRSADITDPDATNPDGAIPTNAFDECDAQPSGVGCNNIKTNSATFYALPSAGADQVVEKNATVTLTATIPGTWSQVGTTPSVALISSPSSSSTSVNGFILEGDYKFAFTNASGCSDTVSVNVTSVNLDAPNVVTPNGDGKNDFLIVPGIENYPGSKVSIYNRWGNEVYHSENYDNDWAGRGLSEGTYFYMLNRIDKAGKVKVFKGWIYLKH